MSCCSFFAICTVNLLKDWKVSSRAHILFAIRSNQHLYPIRSSLLASPHIECLSLSVSATSFLHQPQPITLSVLPALSILNLLTGWTWLGSLRSTHSSFIFVHKIKLINLFIGLLCDSDHFLFDFTLWAVCVLDKPSLTLACKGCFFTPCWPNGIKHW